MTGSESFSQPRVDLVQIASLVDEGARVLDVGCGHGELLELLVREKKADARGIEISPAGVHACLARGLSVIQGDANIDLADYPDQAFDYVILSQTVQAMHDTKDALSQMLRIGRQAIVSFPNFGYWKVRLSLLFAGRMPSTDTLKHAWYNTPNIHLCTIRDFAALCDEMNIEIKTWRALGPDGKPAGLQGSLALANLFGDQGLFVLTSRAS